MNFLREKKVKEIEMEVYTQEEVLDRMRSLDQETLNHRLKQEVVVTSKMQLSDLGLLLTIIELIVPKDRVYLNRWDPGMVMVGVAGVVEEDVHLMLRQLKITLAKYGQWDTESGFCKNEVERLIAQLWDLLPRAARPPIPKMESI